MASRVTTPERVAHTERIGTRSRPCASAPARKPPNAALVPRAGARIASPKASPDASKAARSVGTALKRLVS